MIKDQLNSYLRWLALLPASIAANIGSPFVFTAAFRSLATWTFVDIAGLNISPVGMSVIFGLNYTLGGVLTNLNSWFVAPIGPRTSKQLTLLYDESLMKQSLDDHNTISLGERNNLFIRCFTGTPKVVTAFLGSIAPTVGEIAIAVAVISSKSGFDTTGLILAAFWLILATIISTGEQDTILTAKMLEKGIGVYAHFGEIVSNYYTVQIFNNELRAVREMGNATNTYTEAESASTAITPKLSIGQAFISGMGFTLICLLLALGIASGRDSIDSFSFTIFYLITVATRLNSLGTGINQFDGGLKELESVIDEIARKPAVTNYNPGKELSHASENGEFKFDGVSFYHPSQGCDVSLMPP